MTYGTYITEIFVSELLLLKVETKQFHILTFRQA
jgi:hypothetical protein